MTTMPQSSLGHVVLNVRSLAVSVPFYCRVIGLEEVARNEVPMVFLSFGDKDHDVALRQVEPGAQRYDNRAVGLRHVAFRIGGKFAELLAFKQHLDACGVPSLRIQEHLAITSLYFSDPDGIELEAYVEHPPETWRDRQSERYSRLVLLK